MAKSHQSWTASVISVPALASTREYRVCREAHARHQRGHFSPGRKPGVDICSRTKSEGRVGSTRPHIATILHPDAADIAVGILKGIDETQCSLQGIFTQIVIDCFKDIPSSLFARDDRSSLHRETTRLAVLAFLRRLSK
jgi:hypothetical protein